MKTALLVVAGFFFLSIGTIGLLVPVLPTTPFVILSTVCFSSTPRLKARMLRLKFFGEHIENYEKRQGLSTKTFVQSLVFLWTMLTISVLIVWEIYITLLLMFIGVAVTVHIIWISKGKGEK